MKKKNKQTFFFSFENFEKKNDIHLIENIPGQFYLNQGAKIVMR